MPAASESHCRNADGRLLVRLRRQAIGWYRRHARDLPWRRTPDPYRIWVSEIMLQQTTVAAVVPYFGRFIARFPTVRALAAASQHDVLRLWEGLGYYSRARNLHAAARQVVAEHNATIPSDVTALMRLPGIGRYTAGAIASLAFNLPAPIVEANTLRVYARLLALTGDPQSARFRDAVWHFAEMAVPRRSAGDFNQALMDLGATVCTPAEPRCAACPLRTCCAAFRRGLQRQIPRPKRRMTTQFVREAMVAVRKNGAYLLRRRMPGERWAGLWDFIRLPWDDGPSRPDGALCRLAEPGRTQLERALAEQCGLLVRADAEAFEFSHSVTRFRIRLTCVTAAWRGGALRTNRVLRWVPPSEFKAFALSAPARKFADRLADGRPE